MNKEDLINANYRSKRLSDTGQDPGDIVGSEASLMPLLIIPIFFLLMLWDKFAT
tara:strand:+ start:53 stop:214 length:162 start_codon:yes stop_codon:yes gene_type:complete